MSALSRILFEVSHPKHVHQFRHLAQELAGEYELLFAARDKEVVVSLLEASGLDYREYGMHVRGLASKVGAIPRLLWDYGRLARAYRPHVIVSKASPYAAVIGPLVKAKTVIMPDSEVVPLTNRIVAPLSDVIVTPRTFSLTLGTAHQRVDGLFEEGYLHPSRYQPDGSIWDALQLEPYTPYAVVRFVGWDANHDIGKHGFSLEEKEALVHVLEQHGQVFISSESTLPPHLAAKRLNTEADRIHDVLHFASLYVGDSQTMATEAALLGTPSVRYNSFVGEGDMSNFKLLEKEYGLLVNASDFDGVRRAVSQLVERGTKESWLEKRRVYFSAKPDMNEQLGNILRETIENS